MPSQRGKNKVSLKESGILLVFLSIILFLPLIVLYSFENSWSELSWRNTTDIAMLEWTGAFLSIFMFLLMLETYRTTGRTLFTFIACGFLSMGFLNFIYAVNTPGTETACWLRVFSIITGSICFAFSIPARKKQSFDIAGAIVKFVIPTLLISLLAAWIPFSLKQILPKLITPAGRISLFGSLLLLIPCALFFFTALVWLHEYIKKTRRVDFLIAVTIFIFAQMTLLMRNAQVWGVLWWLWHILWITAILIAAVYILFLSVSRSIVWKLVFSLGLAFSLTVILASGIIQSHSEKMALASFRRHLHEQHKKLILEEKPKLIYTELIIKTLMINTEKFCTGNISYTEDFTGWLQEYMNIRNTEWTIFSENFGYYSEKTGFILPGTNKLNPEQQETIRKHWMNNSDTTSDIRWVPFYHSSPEQKWYSAALKNFNYKGAEGVFFVIVDVTDIVRASLLPGGNGFTNTIVYSLRNGQLLHAAFSKKDLFGKNEKTLAEREKNPFIRKLIAATFDMGNDGKMILAAAGTKKFFISAQRVEPAGWGVLKIINADLFPAVKPESRYFFIAVGMITLLCGFMVLLFLLHRQLSKPFSRLLHATEQLENGNFDITLKTSDETEIGAITRAFNHMAHTLKELYCDLAESIAEKTKALEEAKKADSAKVTFFQNISHELRTPLHGILSFARLGRALDTKKNPDKTVRYFNTINESGERLMGMLDSIMDLAKLEAGNISFNFQLSDLFLTASNVKRELEAAFLEKGIKLIIRNSSDSMKTYFDSEMMARVFRNLLGNALKMSPSGSEVQVMLEKQEDHIKVTVSDEGPGIPNTEFNNIFDKFVQVGEGRRRGGTGLGLAICREIIHAHGGLISAKNNPEKGASFIFSIPLRSYRKPDEKTK